MKKIYKYTLEPETHLNLPMDAKIISVRDQHGTHICLWALVDTDCFNESRTFVVLATGAEVEDGLEYLGSAHLHGGSLVFHVFEKINTETA